MTNKYTEKKNKRTMKERITEFGVVGNWLDPQATIKYKGSYVLPEITVTPKENFYLESSEYRNGGPKKNILDTDGKVRITAPDGTVKEFDNSYAALMWFDENYGNDYSLVELNSKIQSLPEVTVTALKTIPWWDRNITVPLYNASRNFSENDPIFGNRRVRGVQRVLQRNPYALDNWKVGENVLEGVNIMSAGLLNRLSPTLNIGLAIDAFLGDNIVASWLGISGIYSEKFALEHPYISTGINAVLDIGTYKFGLPIINYVKKQTAPILLSREIAKGPMEPVLPPKPQTRYRAGDVEINDPNLNYRQGSPEMVLDFQNTGQVRVHYTGEEAAIRVKKPGVLLLTKSFENPMFKLGGLWYDGHIPRKGGAPKYDRGLLVTKEPLRFSNKSSSPSKFDRGGRRIPTGPDQLNLSNTTGYIWEDGYGFRRIGLPQPISLFPKK